MILDEIKKQNIQAMKDHDQVARSIFSVVMNKAMLEGIKKREKGEELVDADMVAILQKTIKELTEECENFKKVNNQEQIETIERQKEIISKFLPQMMSQDEIYAIIEKINDKSIGNVMKTFKTQYAGKCDMRDVQTVLKRFN